ncbi:hypothetical protein SAMN04488109_2648 [Chryseolinea serpens]|uniref:Lipocalin-like domain-containing protein n=1 Tax=Chryseolinea serpens TaxID=947013 RepID=A0A1M5P4K1_9BACT|nr:hypothetical protein [Chryseolinea serpens]SHG96123.1 hypothetical protein SAMN04488109_2648 [Chryseolinea serpens]
MTKKQTLKLIIFLFILAGCHRLYAQESLTKEALYGEWLCREVTNLADDPETKAVMETMKKGFLNSRFIFKTDGTFNLIFPKESPAVVKEMSFLNNRKWFFYPDKSMISIGTLKENLMQIFVKEQNGKLIFLIYETPLALEMEKMPKP